MGSGLRPQREILVRDCGSSPCHLVFASRVILLDRIHAELAKQGHATSQRRVRRLARSEGLRCVQPAAKRTTTTVQDVNHRGLVDLVERDFFPSAPNEVWYDDVTYVWTMAGWAYLAIMWNAPSSQST